MHGTIFRRSKSERRNRSNTAKGSWSREELIEVDRRAVQVMARYHPHLLLRDNLQREPHLTPRARRLRLVQEVAERYGVTVADILSHCRGVRIDAARLEAIYLVYHGTRLSFCQIAEMFDRDRSTIQQVIASHANKCALPHKRAVERTESVIDLSRLLVSGRSALDMRGGRT